MEFAVIFLTFSLTWILSQSTEEITDILTTDACKNSGKQLVCEPGRILRIIDVICLPHNYTCPEKPRILSICDGQNSCGTVGLKDQIWSYCKGFTLKQMIISYRCVRALAPHPCRTNLCSDESEGLFCKPGNAIHIREAFCVNPDTECNWNILHTLYILCEGKVVCYASGLRLFMPNSTCLNSLPRNANLLVDYICIPETLSNDLCTGQMLTLPNAFGIIKSPGFPSNPYGNPKGCFWAIVPGRNQFVEVTIHVLFSRDNARFLHITYTDCPTEKVEKKDYCCMTTKPSIVQKSCGALYIRHNQYPAGEEHGNRFVISYQVLKYRPLRPSYAHYVTPCSSLYATYNQTSAYTTRGDRTFLVNGGGTYNNTDEVTISSFDPERFYNIFKIVVINFFLFVIAFWIVMAICLVCCRYCTLRKTGQYKLATQSDTDSGHSGRRTDPGGTSMQTFSEGIEESPERESCFNHIEKRNTRMFTSVSSEGPYTAIDKSTYNSNDNSVVNNRTTSFRPPKIKNPYASYDSLDFEDAEEGTNANSSSNMQTSTISDFPPPPPPELLENAGPPTPPPPLKNQNNDYYHQENTPYQNGATEQGVQHYQINDDDYAIVQKPKRKPQLVPKPKQAHNPMYDHVPSASNSRTFPCDHHILDTHSGAGRPQETKGQSPKRHQVGYLPQHNCILECEGTHPHNFPPPAQMNRQRINGNAYPSNVPYSPERTDYYY
ncbi:uncharacterized protein LOC143064430 isoform X1 [Mytilus galloprovincialis]|uniref:uncharacterized protein LOC143064430 isoform X1 n=2 Tax=Mytilus galloprovincialis TaxID=29158 RepID=UPI003F7C85C2